MTTEELAKMTLLELEHVAARFQAALNVLAEARKLLGGTSAAGFGSAINSCNESAALGEQRKQSQSTVEWTPAEFAERERMRRARLEALPENIRALEEK